MIGTSAIHLWALIQGHGAEPQGHGEPAAQEVGEVWNEHMLTEVADGDHLIIPFLNREINLPHWAPIELGPLSIDLSPTKHVIYLILAAVVCAVIMIWTARRTHGKGAERAPTGLANMIEAFVIYIRDEVAMRGVGKGGERYAPFLLTIFFFILFMNLLGLVPFGAAATGNIAVTTALAIVALVAIEIVGLIEMGPREYAKTIFFVPKGVPWWLLPIMVVIMSIVELLSKLTRIFALAIRLFANMNAGHFVLLSLLGLIFLAGTAEGPVKYVVWPAPVLMAVGVLLLEIFVALLQAYIFTMLTSVFIGLVRHPH